MGQVTATADATIPAAPSEVLAALADYDVTRQAILTSPYSDYAVQEGGQGAGTVVTWRLQVTDDRVRHVIADITTDADSVTETDRNSTLVTIFQVKPEGAGSKVVMTTTWEGASGVGGFFEGIFAPVGLGRIQTELLGNLAAHMTAA